MQASYWHLNAMTTAGLAHSIVGMVFRLQFGSFFSRCGFPKIMGTFWGVPIIRITIYWGPYWGSLF